MRNRIAALVAAAALVVPALSGSGVPATAAPVGPGFTSPNVEWLGQIPDAMIGAKFITDKAGKAVWMYATGPAGLRIYDVRNPELPLLTGTLPLPHFENEDVDGNEDVALISTSPGGELYIIDTRNKNAPTLALRLDTGDGDAHTTSCIDGCKRWAYASDGSFLKVVDLQAALKGDGDAVHRVEWDAYVGSAHDIDQDAAGIVWMTGGRGGAGYAIRPLTTGVSAAVRAKTRKASPTNPVNVTNMFINGENTGRGPEVNDFIMHNSQRPLNAVYKQRKGRPAIAKGGVLLVTEEDYMPEDAQGGCTGAGRFHTYDASGSVTGGKPLRRLDTFELKHATLDPVEGHKQMGNVFCGAHWFTVRDNVVAIGMYGAGTRFLDVSDPRDIKQVGFWFAPDQLTWGAYWVPGSDGVVYTADVERGIDILKFRKPARGATYQAPAPVRTKAEKLRFDAVPAGKWGAVCLTLTPRRPVA